MADITNKNKLQRRIELFLDDELDYSINEDFCKETMKMMREFIGHASHRLDCEESRVKNLKKKLKEYRDLEEQGLLLRLPCKIGSQLYKVYKKPTKCTAYGAYKEDYACQGCCEKECDSSYVWDIYKYKADIKTIVSLSDEIGKTVFLTQAEAEQKLKEMECD